MDFQWRCPKKLLMRGREFVAVDEDDAGDFRIAGKRDLSPRFLFVVGIEIPWSRTSENRLIGERAIMLAGARS